MHLLLLSINNQLLTFISRLNSINIDLNKTNLSLSIYVKTKINKIEGDLVFVSCNCLMT